MRLLHLKVVLAADGGNESSLNVLGGAHELAMAAGAALHVIHVGSHFPRHRRFVEAGLSARDAALHVVDGDAADSIRLVADRIHADVIVLGRHRAQMVGSTALAVASNFWAPCLILGQALRLPLERVLVPVDRSDTARGALVTALSWASALRGAPQSSGPTSQDAPVDLTALYVEGSIHDRLQRASRTHTLEDELTHIRRDAGGWAQVAINGAVVANSDAALAIADYAREQQADLVVLGTRGLGLDGEPRLGSTALGVLQRVTVPVLLVPPAVWISYAAAAEP